MLALSSINDDPKTAAAFGLSLVLINLLPICRMETPHEAVFIGSTLKIPRRLVLCCAGLAFTTPHRESFGVSLSHMTWSRHVALLRGRWLLRSRLCVGLQITKRQGLASLH